MNRYAEIAEHSNKVREAWKAFFEAKYDHDLARGLSEDAYNRAQGFRDGGRMKAASLNDAKEWQHKAKVARRAMVRAWINIIRVS